MQVAASINDKFSKSLPFLNRLTSTVQLQAPVYATENVTGIGNLSSSKAHQTYAGLPSLSKTLASLSAASPSETVKSATSHMFPGHNNRTTLGQQTGHSNHSQPRFEDHHHHHHQDIFGISGRLRDLDELTIWDITDIYVGVQTPGFVSHSTPFYLSRGEGDDCVGSSTSSSLSSMCSSSSPAPASRAHQSNANMRVSDGQTWVKLGNGKWASKQDVDEDAKQTNPRAECCFALVARSCSQRRQCSSSNKENFDVDAGQFGHVDFNAEKGGYDHDHYDDEDDDDEDDDDENNNTDDDYVYVLELEAQNRLARDTWILGLLGYLQLNPTPTTSSGFSSANISTDSGARFSHEIDVKTENSGKVKLHFGNILI
jgi:hypothetical protein